MYSLQHIEIVRDAAMLELATWDGENEEVKKSALSKMAWVEKRLDELSLTNDLCINCSGKGCAICEDCGYFNI